MDHLEDWEKEKEKEKDRTESDQTISQNYREWIAGSAGHTHTQNSIFTTHMQAHIQYQ